MNEEQYYEALDYLDKWYEYFEDMPEHNRLEYIKVKDSVLQYEILNSD